MRKNIFSIIASILSFIALVLGIIKLIPQFNKAVNPDQTWISFIATAFPLMIFIYAVAGTDKDAKSVAPNAYGFVLTIPAIIASMYLGSWIEVLCLVIVAFLIIQQLYLDLNEEEKKH
jgi:lipid-A-disaccharide synthase-like uncharacterized protein